MMVIILTILILFMTAFIAKMQMSFQKTKRSHLTEVIALQEVITGLLKTQNELYQKVHVLDDFDKNYKNSRDILSKEILALQYEFLKNIRDKNTEID